MRVLRQWLIGSVLLIGVAVAALSASGTQTSSIILKIAATNTKAGNLGITSSDPLSLDYTLNLSSGTGANQASNIYRDQRTLTASATEDLDLAGSLTNAFGVTLTFTKIKAIIIHAASGNTNDVLVGGDASNQFATWITTATDSVKVKPGGTFMMLAPDATGYAVTAATGDLLKITNSAGTTSVTYDVVLIGVD